MLVLIGLAVSLHSGMAAELAVQHETKNTNNTVTESPSFIYSTDLPHGFQMAWPKGWTFMTSSEVVEKTKGAFQPTPGAFAFVVKDKDFDQNVNVQFRKDVRSELPTMDTVRHFLKTLEERTPSMMNGKVDGFKLTSSAIVEMAGGLALDHTFEMRRGDIFMKQRQIALIAQGKAFIITCGAKKSDFDSANHGCFANLIKSIRVVN